MLRYSKEEYLAVKLQISQMPPVEVLRKDLIIDVEIDEDKLGEFRFSKGSVDFYQKGAKKEHHWATWQKLAELLIDHCTEKS